MGSSVTTQLWRSFTFKDWKDFLTFVFILNREVDFFLPGALFSTMHFLLPSPGGAAEAPFPEGLASLSIPWLLAAIVLASPLVYLFLWIWECSECSVATFICQWLEPKEAERLVLPRELKWFKSLWIKLSWELMSTRASLTVAKNWVQFLGGCKISLLIVPVHTSGCRSQQLAYIVTQRYFQV